MAVDTDVADPGVMEGAATVVAVHKPRPWKPKLLMPTLLNLSRGVVVAVDTDVADPGVMDGAATVAEVLKRSLKGRKRKKLSHEWCVKQTLCLYAWMHGLYYCFVRMSK